MANAMHRRQRIRPAPQWNRDRSIFALICEGGAMQLTVSATEPALDTGRRLLDRPPTSRGAAEQAGGFRRHLPLPHPERPGDLGQLHDVATALPTFQLADEAAMQPDEVAELVLAEPTFDPLHLEAHPERLQVRPALVVVLSNHHAEAVGEGHQIGNNRVVTTGSCSRSGFGSCQAPCCGWRSASSRAATEPASSMVPHPAQATASP